MNNFDALKIDLKSMEEDMSRSTEELVKIMGEPARRTKRYRDEQIAISVQQTELLQEQVDNSKKQSQKSNMKSNIALFIASAALILSTLTFVLTFIYK